MTPEQLVKEIGEELARQMREGSLPYKLSMSVGYSQYSPATPTATRLIAAADAMLYEHKETTRSILRKDKNDY